MRMKKSRSRKQTGATATHRSDKAMVTEGNFYLTLQSSIGRCFSPPLQHHGSRCAAHALPMAPGAGGIRACSPDLPSPRPKLANSTRRPRAYSAASALPSRLPRPPSIRRGAVAVACASEQQSSPAVAAKAARPEPDTLSVEFRTRDGCRLGIARYPDFAYNAQGGRGVGAGCGEDGTVVLVDFDVATLYIPSMSGATTRFLGLPLPPFLKIDILPEALGGTIDRATGQVTACVCVSSRGRLINPVL